MKIKNILIIGAVLLALYLMVGFNFREFYFGGKNRIIETGEQINNLCNDNGACPQTLEGWQVEGHGKLRKEKMLYLVDFPEEGEEIEKGMKPQSFSLVYLMTIPDHWFEVQGGVGRQITSGWESRRAEP